MPYFITSTCIMTWFEICLMFQSYHRLVSNDKLTMFIQKKRVFPSSLVVWYLNIVKKDSVGPVVLSHTYTVLLIKFLPSLPITAERGSAPSAPFPPKRATSGIATCSVVGDTYRPVAKLSPALGWWTLPCLAYLWARIRARPAIKSTGWRNTVTNV